jgi:hypothetical protein
MADARTGASHWLSDLPDTQNAREARGLGAGRGCQKLIVPIYPSNTDYWDQAVDGEMPRVASWS